MSGFAPPIDFLLVTALPQERDAVLGYLAGFQRLAPDPEDNYVYYRATIPFSREDGSKGTYEVVLTTPLGESRVQAAIATTMAIQRWRPAHVLVIGYAIGVSANTITRGDLLIADQIVDYESQRLEGDQLRPYWQGYQVDARLMAQLQAYRGTRWHTSPRRLRPGKGQPRLHIGPIASGDKVIASTQQLAWLTETWHHLIGFETEAGGVVAATAQAPSRPRFFMIRGVASLAESKHDDRWQAYACAVAAAFTVAFLRSGPVIPRPVDSFAPTAPVSSRGATPTSPALGVVSPAGYSLINSSITLDLERLGATIADQLDRELALLREQAREGGQLAARERLAEMRNNQNLWDSLAASRQVKILQLIAQLDLDLTGDLDSARRLAEEVRTNDASTAALLDALIAHRANGPADALAVLGERTDLEGRHLRAGLLLADGDAGASLAVLTNIIANGEPTAETFRLQALAQLARRDLAASILSVEEASRRAPRWSVVRQVSAVLNYWSAVSPLALPEGLVAWPLPPNWILVKRDDQSRERLSAAAAIFEGLAANVADVEARRGHRRWQLACLGNDATRQDEALALCTSILREHPDDSCALAWGLARSWPIDTAPGYASLGARVKDGTATSADIVDLVAIDVHVGEATRAVHLLSRSSIRELFNKSNALDEFERLRAHVAAAAGENHQAKVLTSEDFSSHEARQARTVALLTVARSRSGERDWDRLAKHLARSSAETGEPIYHLLHCQILAEREQWADLAAEADWLLETVGTADALRLAATAAFYAGRAEQCLSLLSKHLDLFPNTRLPADLKELQLHAYRASGRILSAIALAEELARETEDERNLVRLARLRWEGADRRGVADVARRLAALGELSDEALWVAAIAAEEDRTASIAIWERVTTSALSPGHIPDAVYVGQRLGLRSRIEPLLAQLAAAAQTESGNRRDLSETEFRTHTTEVRRRFADLTARYRRGEIPFHILPESPVARYHALLSENASSPDPHRQQPLFARHGGRAMASEVVPESAGRLVVDLTGLILAAHLDLLDVIERASAPIFLPPGLPLSLGAMRTQITRDDPEELELARAIVRLAAAGRISSDPALEGLVAAAHQAAATVLYRRRETIDDSKIEGEDSFATRPSFAPLSAVASVLRRAGDLAANDYERAAAVLGGAVAPDQIPNWSRGTLLYCDGASAILLARAKILAPASRRFRIVVPTNDLSRLRAADERDENARALDDWLAALQDRVRNGLASNVYALLPYPAHAEERDAAGGLLGNASLPSFEQLLHANLQNNDLVWVDDRFVSRYDRISEAAIVGTLEMLDYLRDGEHIDAARHQLLVDQLRAANVRFIPLQSDELAYHLDRTELDGDELLETRELAVLRRYTAACLLAGADLQRPSAGNDIPSTFGEAEVVLNFRRTIADRLAAVWEDDDVHRAEVRGWWLLEALYLDPLAALDITGLIRPDHDRRELHALGFADIVSQAITLHGSASESVQTRRRRYLAWIHEHLLSRQFGSDPELKRITAAFLGTIIGDLVEAARELPGGGQLVARLWAEFYLDLPEELQDALASNTALLGRLGLERRTEIRIGGLTFDVPAWEGALTAALNGKSTTILARDPDVKVVCEPLESEDSTPRCRLVRQDTGEEEFPETGQLVLMLGTLKERVEGLRRFPGWFDCEIARRERVIAAIASLPTIEARHLEVRRWRARSVAEHFDALARRVLEDRSFRFTDLLPTTIEGLPDHLRLDPHLGTQAGFVGALEQSAHSLIADLGPVAAFARLGAIPVNIPKPLIDTLAAEEVTARQSTLRRFLRSAVSPILLAQAVWLIRHFAEDDSANLTRFRGLIGRVVGRRGLAACTAFWAILEWVTHEITARQEAQEWHSAVRIAAVWSCADRIYRILRAAGAPDEALLRGFQAEAAPPEAVLSWDATFALDVAHPQQSRPLPILAAACAYALDGADDSLLPGDWRERWAELAVTRVGGTSYPSIPLLRDLTHAGNSLESWLARPTTSWLAPLLGSDGQLLGSQAANERIAWAIAALQDSKNELDAWTQLHVTAGPLPVDPALAEALAERLQEVNLVETLRRNETLGIAALETTAVQARAIGDQAVLRNLREQILAIAEFAAVSQSEGYGEEDEKSVRLSQTLMASALWLAQADGGDLETIQSEASKLMDEILDRYPAAASLARHTLLRWCLALTGDQGSQFWRTLTHSRAL